MFDDAARFRKQADECREQAERVINPLPASGWRVDKDGAGSRSEARSVVLPTVNRVPSILQEPISSCCWMNDQWYESLRCPVCGKTGRAKLAQENDAAPVVQSVPEASGSLRSSTNQTSSARLATSR
jgi:hypothetical protein